MRLANDLAALALEHVREKLRPGMREAEVAALWEGAVHAHGTGFEGKVENARGYALVWSGPGIKTFTATSDRPIAEHEPTLFEIWVSADGYWCDHTKNLCPGELDPRYAELEEQLLAVYDRAVAHCRDGADLPELDRLVRAGIADAGYPGPAVAPDRPRRRRARARAALRTPGRLRHHPQGNGSRDRAGDLLGRRRRPARRGQLARHRRRAGEALLVPGRDRARVTIPREQLYLGDLNRRALEAQAPGHVGLYDTTLRDGEQPSALRSAPTRSSRSRGSSTSSGSTASRPDSRACRTTTREPSG